MLHSFLNDFFHANKLLNLSNNKLYQFFVQPFLKLPSNKLLNSSKRETVSNITGAINNMGFQIRFYKTRFLKSTKWTLPVLVLRKFTVTTVSNSFLISNMNSSFSLSHNMPLTLLVPTSNPFTVFCDFITRNSLPLCLQFFC